MKASPLDQDAMIRHAREIDRICRKNGWPVVLLACMGGSQKKAVGVMRVAPHDPDFVEAVGLYPKVGAPLMAAALVYSTASQQEPQDVEP